MADKCRCYINAKYTSKAWQTGKLPKPCPIHPDKTGHPSPSPSEPATQPKSQPLQGKDDLEDDIGFELCGEIKCNQECGGYLFCDKIDTLVQKILRFVSDSQQAKCAECKDAHIRAMAEKEAGSHEVSTDKI